MPRFDPEEEDERRKTFPAARRGIDPGFFWCVLLHGGARFSRVGACELQTDLYVPAPFTRDTRYTLEVSAAARAYITEGAYDGGSTSITPT